MTAVQRLFALEQFGIKLGLDNIRSILAALGNPERAWRSIHIAGTNGKGSVAAMVECGLRAGGLTTGRYTYAFYYAEGFEELYDHVRDPAETRNLADHPFYARTLSALRHRTRELRTCAGAGSCSRHYPGVPGPLLGLG